MCSEPSGSSPCDDARGSRRGRRLALIASAPKGALVDEPEFGITDPTFTINPPTVLIAAQVKEWEPRGQVTAVEAEW